MQMCKEEIWQCFISLPSHLTETTTLTQLMKGNELLRWDVHQVLHQICKDLEKAY
jgi:hypothetical protein